MPDATLNISYSAVKTAPASLKFSTNFGVTMSGSELSQATQVITTASWQALTWGAITGTPSIFVVTNLDPTNYVQLATANDSTGIFATLQPGQSQPVLGVSGVTYYAKAHTASVRVFKNANEA